MAAAAPNPSNLLLLAVLGVGAFLLYQRQARAAGAPSGSAVPAATQRQWAANDAGLWAAVGKIIGPVTQAMQSGYQRANETYNGVGSNTDGGASGDPYNSDGYAINPAPGYSLDAFFSGLGESGD